MKSRELEYIGIPIYIERERGIERGEKRERKRRDMREGGEREERGRERQRGETERGERIERQPINYRLLDLMVESVALDLSSENVTLFFWKESRTLICLIERTSAIFTCDISCSTSLHLRNTLYHFPFPFFKRAFSMGDI